MFIRWGYSCSTKYLVTNDVILSPSMFNVYMNNLSQSLNHSGIWESIGDNLINHLLYSDDLCLIALSSAGMPTLLGTCHVYATSHQLSYNATKTFSLCFKQNQIKITLPSFALGKHVIPAVDKCNVC